VPRQRRRARVTDRVKFLQQDMYETDVRKATVVLLYLYPDANLRLLPRLRSELRPGARIVSNLHDFGTWFPRTTIRVHKTFLHLWVMA